MEELSEEDKQTVWRARKIQRFLSQPFFVAEVFTNMPGKLVPLEESIKGFKAILAGEYDHLPDAAFSMVGTIEEVVEKAEKLARATMSSDSSDKKKQDAGAEKSRYTVDELAALSKTTVEDIRKSELASAKSDGDKKDINAKWDQYLKDIDSEAAEFKVKFKN
jgi:hypothetical protein